MPPDTPLTRPRPAVAFSAPAPPAFGVRQFIGATRRHWWIPAIALLLGLGASLIVEFRPVGVFQSTGTVRVPDGKTGAAIEQLQSREFVQRVVTKRGLRVFDPETQLPSTAVRVFRVSAPRDSMVWVRMTFAADEFKAKMGDAEAVSGYADTVWFQDLEFVLTRRPAAPAANLVVVPETNAVDLLASSILVREGDAPGVLDVRLAAFSAPVAQLMANYVVDEYQSMRASSASGDSTVIQSRPSEATPLRENTGRYVTIVMGLALLTGVIGVLLRERYDGTIRRRNEMEHVLRVPGLAIIPPLPAGYNYNDDATGVAHDAFRALRARLLESNGVPAPRSVVVTSAVVDDGSTTTASNLAIAFADKGRRVLLIDCEMRRPRLHALFELPQVPGLSELLMDKAELQDAFRKTSVRNLYVLPAGSPPLQPAVLLTGKRFGALLASLAMLFDIVIIDAPPLLTATDASVLAGMSDGVVLVVRAGRTDRYAGQEAVRQLGVARAHVIGAVMNDVDGTAARYESYN